MGVPPKSSMVDVQINVLRNNFSPSFMMSQYEANITETQPYGIKILNTSATDQDAILQPEVSAFHRWPITFQSISFSCILLTLQTPNAEVTYEINQYDDLANAYFGIDRSTGRISIIQPLTIDRDLRSRYQVRPSVSPPSSFPLIICCLFLQFTVYAMDGGQPQRQGSAQVVINVKRESISAIGIMGFRQPLYM